MEENKEKQLDEFTKRIITEVGLETPSADFTASVISKIRSETKSTKNFVYKPLISKQVWSILAILVIGVFSYAFFGSAGNELDWLPVLKLNRVPEFNMLNRFSNYSISNTAMCGVVGFALFVGIQIFMLKHHFNKQIATY